MGMPCNTWHFACITWVLKGLHGSILPGHVFTCMRPLINLCTEFHRPTEQILLGNQVHLYQGFSKIKWGKFCLVIRFVPGWGHWVIGPMTPPWYKTNNPAEFADLIFETPWYKWTWSPCKICSVGRWNYRPRERVKLLSIPPHKNGVGTLWPNLNRLSRLVPSGKGAYTLQ